MDEQEWYWCGDCEEADCDCGAGFWWEDDVMLDPECPCCGSTDVQV